MTSKSSIARCISAIVGGWKAAAVLSLPVIAILVCNAAGQSPSPSPTPQKLAFVRFWNMLPAKPNANNLELFESDNNVLTVAAPVNSFADYLPVSPGTFTFAVCRPENVKEPLKRLPVTIPADTYVTIVVSEKEGQPIVEGLNDTIDPKATAITRLVLRQYIVGAQVTASIDGAAAIQPMSYGAVQVLDNVPAAQLTINLRGTLANGTTQNWTVPADLTTNHHGTLLIVTDAYGRFRPRFAVDGHASAPPGRHY